MFDTVLISKEKLETIKSYLWSCWQQSDIGWERESIMVLIDDIDCAILNSEVEGD